jgi:anti-anti-sigma factor
MTECKLEDNKLLCSFNARLDVIGCQDIEEKIAEGMKENPESVTFDMTGVEYISSAFLRICIMTAKKSPSGKFEIAGAAPAVKKVFKMAKLDDIISITK